MFCNSENLPSTPQSQFKSGAARGNVGSLHVILSHTQSRGGSCSELSCLRSKDICLLSVLSIANLQSLMFVALMCFFHPELPGDICGGSVETQRTFIFVLVLGTHLHLLRLLTLLVCLLMGSNWLFVLIICWLSYTSQLEIALLESGSSIRLICLFCLFVYIVYLSLSFLIRSHAF
jgi:hypothetical protein